MALFESLIRRDEEPREVPVLRDSLPNAQRLRKHPL
jgi:hypothetical protein